VPLINIFLCRNPLNMKKQLLLLLVFTILTIACKKSELRDLPGSWVLVSADGGISPGSQNTSGSGIVFTDNTYKRYQNGKEVQSGTYQIVRDKIDGKKVYRLTFDGYTGDRAHYFEIKKNNLRIYPGPLMADALEYWYQKGTINTGSK
jgi:hypothetical protein